ncbi:hypothetical protein Acsp05_71040 [Actinokineospora sp. NBRC 105648]|nr:hypothetical protein Acsp05_71040 [Actinokineospora sp. NBRC 105648]
MSVVVLATVAGCGAPLTGPASDPGLTLRETTPITPTSPTGPTGPTTRESLPPPACPPEGVLITPLTPEAAMGLRVVTLEMVNCGARPYEISGYPVLRVLDGEQRVLPVKVGRGSAGIATVAGFDDPPRSVTLRPGEKARTGLMWRNTVTDSTVTATTGHTLEIAPAEDRPVQRVPLIAEGDRADEGPYAFTLDLGNTGALGVRAWFKV